MNVINRINTSFLVLLSMCIISSCHLKRDTTIYKPVFEKNETSGILEISKIVFTDTATVFYFDAYHCANSGCWFSIAQDIVLQGSHQVYKMTAWDGIEPGKRMTVSESGHLAFVLYFDPVDKLEKTVDFKSGGWHITGIKLYKVPKQQIAGTIRCTLKGEVVDRPQSVRLMLIKEGENLRFTQGVSIPIRDGKFEFVLHCNHEEFYQLIFWDEHIQSSWRPIKFISEQGVINFTLHPSDQFDKNIVSGGKLNKEYREFEIEDTKEVKPFYDALNARNERLRESGKYYTPEVQSILDKMNEIVDESERRALSDQISKLFGEGRYFTPDAKAVEESGDSVRRVMQLWRLQYAKENPNIVGFGILKSVIRDVVQSKNDISQFVEVYQTVFALKFPDHPYSAQMEDLLRSSSLRVGIPFIDFTAVDFNNKQVSLSERISGKPALLHLWASWCGPCRRDGIELIPVYEEFRDKRFVVIGVAREKSISTAEAAAKQDKYPWENLVELNDVEQIWVKYGIGNAAGSKFLIDEKGNIAAVNPSVEEIRNFLMDNE